MAFLLAVDNYQKPHSSWSETHARPTTYYSESSVDVQTQKNAQHSFASFAQVTSVSGPAADKCIGSDTKNTSHGLLIPRLIFLTLNLN